MSSFPAGWNSQLDAHTVQESVAVISPGVTHTCSPRCELVNGLAKIINIWSTVLDGPRTPSSKLLNAVFMWLTCLYTFQASSCMQWTTPPNLHGTQACMQPSHLCGSETGRKPCPFRSWRPWSGPRSPQGIPWCCHETHSSWSLVPYLLQWCYWGFKFSLQHW